MTAAVVSRPLTVISGLRGLRNVVCLSAVLMSVGQLSAVARVVRVNVQRGEIEVEGSPSGSEVKDALASASLWLDELRRDDVFDDCCAAQRALDPITVTRAG